MSKKLNILFISSWYPSRIKPTTGNFVKRHAEAIALKHMVTVIHAIGDEKLKKPVFEIVRKTEKDVNEIIIYFKKHSFFFVNAVRKYQAYRKGVKLVSYIDIIHGNIIYPGGAFAVLTKLLLKKPLILTEHWTGFLKTEKTNFNWLKKIFIKSIASFSEIIVPVSDTLKTAMIDFGIKNKYKVIGNAVDTSLFYPKEKNNKIFTILHISSLVNRHKNIEGILEIIKILSKNRSDFKFQIIGSENLNETKILASEKKIPDSLIEFIGNSPPEQIAKYMQEADLYVSFSNFETFGVVYVEALATKTPVVCTNTGILTEHKTEDICRIIPIRDKNKLYSIINDFLDNKIYLDTNKMRDFAVDNFSFESVALQYSSLYTNIVNNI